MSTTYNHVQMGIVDSEGTINVMYPLNTAEDVSITTDNTAVPKNVKDLQTLVDNLGQLSFEDNETIVYFKEDPNTNTQNALPQTEIDDNQVSLATTYSSKKIDKLLSDLKSEILNSER